MQALPINEQQISKEKNKKEKKPLSAKVGGFLNKQKYLLMATLLLFITVGVELLQLQIDGGLSVKNITVPLILITFTTYMSFWLMTDCGKEVGINSQKYIEALNNYNKIHDDIKNKGFNIHLKEFCSWKRKTDTEEVIQDLLADSTISYKEYITHYRNLTKDELKEEGLSKDDINVIIQAKNYRAPKLYPSMLWSSGSFAKQVSYITASGGKNLTKRRIIKAVRIIAMSLLVVSMSTGAVLRWNWQVVFEVISVLLNMYFGYRDGYESYAVTDTLSYVSKTQLLTECLTWCETEFPGGCGTSTEKAEVK